MSSGKEKPYFALIGQAFDVWGVVEVSSDTRSHITAKELPPEIAEKAEFASSGASTEIDKKFVLAHTKGFQELPESEALELINTLKENLNSNLEEMNERNENARTDYYADDPKGLRQSLRETKAEFGEYWRDELGSGPIKVLARARIG
jgi:hypothetical protein